MNQPQTPKEIDELRRGPRIPSESEVRVMVHATQLQATSENLSAMGILLVTEETLRVSVELGQPGSGEVRSGRLVRIQKLQEGQVGLAIEFDPR